MPDQRLREVRKASILVPRPREGLGNAAPTDARSGIEAAFVSGRFVEITRKALVMHV
jgi:hypothetical protein